VTRVPGLIWVLVSGCALGVFAQTASNERSFTAPAAAVHTALKSLPGGTSGPLPILDGFVVPGARSLDDFHKPYFQCTVHVTSTPSGGSLVRVNAKITAWNSDPAHSGYVVLPSNGRIESDVLDRLQQLLEAKSANDGDTKKTSAASVARTAPPLASAKADPPPDISAPTRQLPSFHEIAPLNSRERQRDDPELEREAKSLEDILRNQAHPTNLVVVKEEETPVLQSPRTDSPVLFLATAEDEFEILSMNSDWVYVRISGLSRGWIRRSKVEMIGDSDDTNSGAAMASTESQPNPTNSASENSGLFVVSSEAVGGFPGQWEALKGKNVKIISVQLAPGPGHITSPEEKRQFAESELKQVAPSSSAAGVVLIFDSEDGGIVAATETALQEWKTGTLSDDAFWRQCYFDPPEIFGVTQHP
jgi:hypothetical protein